MRLFVGIAIPEDICERFAGLRSGLAGTRWVDVEAMPLTLRFIGTVDAPSAAVDEMAGVMPVTCSQGAFAKAVDQS